MKSFVDYKINLHHKASSTEVAKATSVLMHALHAGFSEIKGDFALAFPDLESKSTYKRLTTFRVFSKNKEDEEKLIEFIRSSRLSQSVYMVLAPRAVPADFSGEYASYSRVRIKSRDRAQERFSTMTQLMNSGAHWIDMRSKSNSNNFRMYLSVKTSNAGTDGKVNSYGLSTAESPVFLPKI